MKLNVTRTHVWAAEIEDRPGALAEKLAALSEAGAKLEFILSRRAPELPGGGVVFLSPLKGRRQTGAAAEAGFLRTDQLHSLQVEGLDRPGLGARMARALAATGINLRGLAGAALGRRFVAYFAFDTAEDTTKALRILKAMK